MKQLWIVRYWHRHGCSVWPVMADEEPTLKSLLQSDKEFAADWEGPKWGEGLEIYGPFEGYEYTHAESAKPVKVRPEPGAWKEGELPPHERMSSLHSDDAKYCFECGVFHPWKGPKTVVD